VHIGPLVVLLVLSPYLCMLLVGASLDVFSCFVSLYAVRSVGGVAGLAALGIDSASDAAATRQLEFLAR
jgi:hypothetical protein